VSLTLLLNDDRQAAQRLAAARALIDVGETDGAAALPTLTLLWQQPTNNYKQATLLQALHAVAPQDKSVSRLILSDSARGPRQPEHFCSGHLLLARAQHLGLWSRRVGTAAFVCAACCERLDRPSSRSIQNRSRSPEAVADRSQLRCRSSLPRCYPGHPFRLLSFFTPRASAKRLMSARFVANTVPNSRSAACSFSSRNFHTSALVPSRVSR